MRLAIRRRRATTGIRVLAKQLTTDPPVMGTIVAAVFMCGLFLTATPLLFAEMADEALLEAVAAPEPQLRNISASLSSYLGASTADDPFARVRELGELFKDAEMSESVQAIVEDLTWVVDSPHATIPGRAFR